MNKTIHINLCGQSFTIDENAYEELSVYINDLKRFYAAEEGLDEMIKDIEARFAEVFTNKLEKGNRQIVSRADVQEVIIAMGRPEDFEGGTESSGAAKQQQGPSASSGGKRLYRDKDDQVVAGVSSGLAAYFNIKDPVWIRILFILLAWFGGGGLLIYIILWIVLPVAKTATQKLEMRGESVNLSNLEKSVRDNIESASDNIKSYAAKNQHTAKENLNRGVNAIGFIAGKVLKVAMFVIKWVFIFVAAVVVFSLIVTLGAMLVATIGGMPIANLVFFEGATLSTMAMFGLLLFLSVPLIILLYLPLRLLFKWKVKSNIAGLTLLAAWIVGLFLLIFSAVNGVSLLSKEYKVKNVITMPVPDTLYLGINSLNETGDFENLNFNDFKYLKKKATWNLDNIQVDITENSDSQAVEVIQYNIARGKDRDNAKLFAERIRYNVRTSADSLLFDDVLSFGTPKKLRAQKIRMTLKVPKNTYVVFGHGMEHIVGAVPLSTMEGAQDDATVYIMRNGVLYPTGSLEGSAAISQVDTRDYEEVMVGEFDQVIATGSLSIKIVGGTMYKVFVHPAMKDEVSIQERNGELEIKRKKGNIVINKSMGSNSTYDCIIYTPQLETIKMSGNVKTEIAGFKEGDLEADVAGISNLNVDGNFNTLMLNVAGKCDIKASGKCIDLLLNIAGISEFHGLKMQSESAEVNIAGASKAEVNARTSLTGQVVGASDLKYAGTPNIEVETYGASTIERAK